MKLISLTSYLEVQPATDRNERKAEKKVLLVLVLVFRSQAKATTNRNRSTPQHRTKTQYFTKFLKYFDKYFQESSKASAHLNPTCNHL